MIFQIYISHTLLFWSVTSGSPQKHILNIENQIRIKFRFPFWVR